MGIPKSELDTCTMGSNNPSTSPTRRKYKKKKAEPLKQSAAGGSTGEAGAAKVPSLDTTAPDDEAQAKTRVKPTKVAPAPLTATSGEIHASKVVAKEKKSKAKSAMPSRLASDAAEFPSRIPPPSKIPDSARSRRKPTEGSGVILSPAITNSSLSEATLASPDSPKTIGSQLRLLRQRTARTASFANGKRPPSGGSSSDSKDGHEETNGLGDLQPKSLLQPPSSPRKPHASVSTTTSSTRRKNKDSDSTTITVSAGSGLSAATVLGGEAMQHKKKQAEDSPAKRKLGKKRQQSENLSRAASISTTSTSSASSNSSSGRSSSSSSTVSNSGSSTSNASIVATAPKSHKNRVEMPSPRTQRVYKLSMRETTKDASTNGAKAKAKTRTPRSSTARDSLSIAKNTSSVSQSGVQDSSTDSVATPRVYEGQSCPNCKFLEESWVVNKSQLSNTQAALEQTQTKLKSTEKELRTCHFEMRSAKSTLKSYETEIEHLKRQLNSLNKRLKKEKKRVSKEQSNGSVKRTPTRTIKGSAGDSLDGIGDFVFKTFEERDGVAESELCKQEADIFDETPPEGEENGTTKTAIDAAVADEKIKK